MPALVASHGMRGLKPSDSVKANLSTCRIPRDAWIETKVKIVEITSSTSRIPRDAWIETSYLGSYDSHIQSRIPRDAWIETIIIDLSKR